MHDQRLSLGMTQTTGEEKIIFRGPAVKLFRVWRRVIKRRRVEPTKFLQTLRDISGVGEELFRFRNNLTIGFTNRGAHLIAVRRVNQIAERVIPKFVRRAELMKDPQDFVLVRNQISGKFETNQQVNRRARDFRKIEQPAGEHVIENFLWRVPLERDRNDFSFMSFGDQRVP